MTNKLLEYLIENGIGQNYLAKKVGCGQATMYRILRNGVIPSLKLALAIEKQTKNAVRVYDWILPKNKNTNKPKNTSHTKKTKINQ